MEQGRRIVDALAVDTTVVHQCATDALAPSNTGGYHPHEYPLGMEFSSMTVTVQSPLSDISTDTDTTDLSLGAAEETQPAAPRRTARRDGDRGLTRAERSEQTAALLGESVTCGPAEREQILERVVLINRGVAEAVASRYRSRGVPQDDLVQAAYEGLTKAVHRFDPLLRNDLLTYAVPTIRGELQRYFRDQGWVVRPPRRVQELQWRVNQTIDRLAQEVGREPTPTEVMDELDIGREEYDEALEAFGCFSPTSLDQPVTSQSATTLGELLADEDSDVSASEARVTLAPVVRNLSERDRRILYLRYFEDRTQEQIGADLGVTQMQVSRLLSRILGQLRDEIS